MNELPLEQIEKPWATYSLIAANTMVFILMAFAGGGIFTANGYVQLEWGSNFAPLTLTGEGWRLVSNIFIHFGIIHLVMNMYALFSVGIFLEPLLGKTRFLTAYFCTGVAASLTSLWWHIPPVNSAGASGAIFGMYGVFFALLMSEVVPKVVRNSLLTSTSVFIIYNLIYGMKEGIDNAAHIGGLVIGFLIGSIYLLPIKFRWLTPAFILLTGFGTALYVQTHEERETVRDQILKEIHESHYPDFVQFNTNLEKVIAFDEAASESSATFGLTVDEFREFLNQVSFPSWEKAQELILEMKQMQVSDRARDKTILLDKYLKLRKKQAKLLDKYYHTEEESLISQMEKNSEKIKALLEKVSS